MSADPRSLGIAARSSVRSENDPAARPNRRLEKGESRFGSLVQMGLPAPTSQAPSNPPPTLEEGADWKTSTTGTGPLDSASSANRRGGRFLRESPKSWPRSIDRLSQAGKRKARPSRRLSPRPFPVLRPRRPACHARASRGLLAAFDSDPEKASSARGRTGASPPFGGRWGRHWMDVAAAESGGAQLLPVPGVPGFVVASFNQDKPYDIFVKEQLAGDLMPSGREDAFGERLVPQAFAMGPKSSTSVMRSSSAWTVWMRNRRCHPATG